MFPNDDLNPKIAVAVPAQSLSILNEYYAVLLGSRKRVIARAVEGFVRGHGREPTTDERAVLVRGVRQYGPRTASLAKKFDEDGSPASVADESVLALGIATALAQQRDVLILTDDLDLHEQFYKLTSLLRDDMAAHLLAEDYFTTPARYSHKIPIPAIVEPLLKDPAASFCIERQTNLDSYFCGDVQTRRITVARVREAGECMTWCVPLTLAAFLEEKSRTWRNSTRFGSTNVYIQLPLPRPESPSRGRSYAFFAADGSGEPDGQFRRISRLDVTRALFDYESFDVGEAAASTYHYAARLAKSEDDANAQDAARKLLRFTHGRDGNRISAVGEARAAFAFAAYQESTDLVAAHRGFEGVYKAHRHSRTHDLRRLALGARLSGARSLFDSGNIRSAIEEWSALELECALDRSNPDSANVGRAAGLNRALNYRFLDLEGAPRAIEHFLVQLGWPPADLDMYGVALFGLSVVYFDIGAAESVRKRCADLLRLASETKHVVGKLNALVAHASIVAVAVERQSKVFPMLFSDLVSAVGRGSFPAETLGEIATRLTGAVQRLELRDLLTQHAPINIGPRCRCCPAAEWARIDLLMAKTHSMASGVDVGTALFRRVREVYGAICRVDRLAADVVRECQREITIATAQGSVRISAPKPSALTSFDHLDVRVLVPHGAPQQFRRLRKLGTKPRV